MRNRLAELEFDRQPAIGKCFADIALTARCFLGTFPSSATSWRRKSITLALAGANGVISVPLPAKSLPAQFFRTRATQ